MQAPHFKGSVPQTAPTSAVNRQVIGVQMTRSSVWLGYKSGSSHDPLPSINNLL